MDSAFTTAVSGLQANAARFRVAAFNVVNANSESFKAQVAAPVSQPPVGVATAISTSDRPVDIASEFVSMIEAEIGYRANAEVVETTRRMTGTLLNTLA